MTDTVAIALIGAIATVGGQMVNAFLLHRNAQKIDRVHNEVKTGNAMKLGEMADAAESRRIGQIAVGDRTPAEDLHIAIVPEKK